MGRWSVQFRALVRKNMILALRRRRTTLVELVTPALLVSLVGVLNFALPPKLPQLKATRLNELKSDVSTPFPCLVFDSENGYYGYGRPIPDSWCVPLVYAPAGNSDVDQIMTTVASRNGFDSPVSASASDIASHDAAPAACAGATASCMLGFASVDALKAWVAAHSGRVGVGVVFGDTTKVENIDGSLTTAQVITSASPLPSDHVKYELWFNSTSLRYKWYAGAGVDALGAYADAESAEPSYRAKDTSLMLTAQRAVDEAILAWHAQRVGRDPSSTNIHLTLSAFPRLEDTRAIAQGFVPLAIFISTAASFLTILTRVTSEKECHATGAFRTTGLLDSCYWLSHWAHVLATSLMTSLLLMLLGMAFRLGVFVTTNAGLLFVILVCYNLSMAAFAFFLSALMSRVRTSAVVGFALLIPCAAIIVLSGVYESISFMWWEKGFPSILTAFFSVFLPPFNLAKLLADAAAVSSPIPTLDEAYSPEVFLEARKTFNWGDLVSFSPNRTAEITYDPLTSSDDMAWYIAPPPMQALVHLLFSIGLYSALAWYLAQIFTGGDAHSQPANFPFSSNYWYWHGAVSDATASLHAAKCALKERLEGKSKDDDEETTAPIDPDVAAEAEAICRDTDSVAAAVEIVGARKRFGKVKAVVGVSLRMVKSQCFALLGHNGAGKTTLLRLATAQLGMDQDAGDVSVHGLSVKTQAAAVRRRLGFCPQHDVLYNELTPIEHLELYGGIKGYTDKEMATDARALLDGVKLYDVKSQPAGSFSGGMKRRLSCAIALVGDPSFVLLDEPTTGMDPMNRREVWSLISTFKADRTILLTTHSMEEADFLGDRIGIMSAGRLIALGSSLHLKDRFGEGYQLRLVTTPTCRDTMKARVALIAPAATLEEDNAGSLGYSIKANEGQDDDAASVVLPKLLEFIESIKRGEQGELELVDWGVSHTTLEDVFLKLAKQGGGQAIETFKTTVRLPRTWLPGTPVTYLATDGMEYEVSADKLPKDAEWKALLASDVAGNVAADSAAAAAAAAKMIEVKKVILDKKFLTDEQKRDMHGTLRVGLHRSPASAGQPCGITLEMVNQGDTYPTVTKVVDMNLETSPHALVPDRRKLKVGDQIKMINFLSTSTARLDDLVKQLDGCYEISLSVLRDPVIAGGHEARSGGNIGGNERKAQSQQLHALLKRTSLLQIRQSCLCCFTVIVPVICIMVVYLYKTLVIDRSGVFLKGLFALQQRAGKNGCGNSTVQLTRMCLSRNDTADSGYYPNCTWCEYAFTQFKTPSGYTVNSCRGTLLNDFTPGANGNQCKSSYFNGGDVKFSQCRVGPGLAYQSEDQLPEWCNCSSSAFDLVVAGTPYCEFNERLTANNFVDPSPVKVPRDLTEPGSGYLFTAQRVAEFVRDEWKDYVGWRIAVAAPAGLDVGAMGGYSLSNGFLGRFNQRSNTSEATRAPVAQTVQISGLIGKMPYGLAHNEPATSHEWTDLRACDANAFSFTCCANSTRRPVVLPDPPWFGAQNCYEAVRTKQAEALPKQRTVCMPCGIWPPNHVHSEQPFFWPLPEECAIGPPPGKVNISWDLDPATMNTTCDTPSCLDSTCTPDPVTSQLRNARCESILPNMTSHCASMKAELASACAANTTWTHSASVALLSLLWSEHRGVLGVTQGAVDRTVGPSLTRAFDYADAWATERGMAFDPAAICAPPFCFDFSQPPPSGALASSWDCSESSLAFDSLKYIYPCFVENVTLADYAISGVPSHSVLEGAMCREAYSIMATVSPGFPDPSAYATVPECSPPELGGAFFSSCGDCTQTACPRIAHYVTPLYEPAVSLDTVAADVLRAQFALRDGQLLSLPAPTTPLFTTTQVTYDQAQTPPFSNDLEKIFPSVGIEFTRLNPANLDVAINLASFWGDAGDWPYVKAPPSWDGDGASFRIVKFQEALHRERWLGCGGMASVILNWMTNALLKEGLGDDNLKLTVGMKPFPYYSNYDRELTAEEDLIGTYTRIIDLVVPLGTCFALPLIAATVVIEKEARLRALMQMMGLRMKFYWLAEWMYNSAVVLLVNLLAFSIGALFNLAFITRSFTVIVVLIFLWSQCLVAMAVLSSTLYSHLLTSYAGNTVLVLVPTVVCYILNTSLSANVAFPTGTFVFAPIAYFRAIHLLTQRTFEFGRLGDEMVAILVMMLLDLLAYGLIAAYLDLTVRRDFGRRAMSPWLCLEPLVTPRSAKSSVRTAAVPASSADSANLAEDSDVLAARRVAEECARRPNRPAEEVDPIETVNLRKVFFGGRKVAVKGLSLSLHQGECFGLLGPNGAGKTTTISMLTGLFLPDGGSARICGFDLATELDQIYRLMGVCPQFDILWHSLTVYETLRFYCQVKGVDAERVRDVAVELATLVDLGHVLDRRVGQLSGGMKRRVSLAISLCGAPRVLFLDEPTTGLDPETKRIMWNLVEFFSQAKRCIILTTHSMEEADALCGRIGIMAHGSLRCLGSSLHLKTKFGAGYKLEVALSGSGGDRSAREAARAFVQAVLGGTSSTADGMKEASGILTFQLGSDVQLSALFSAMHTRPKSARIVNWALRQTSMEEVFLSIALKSEEELKVMAAQHNGGIVGKSEHAAVMQEVASA